MKPACSTADAADLAGPIAELPLALGRERRMHARAFAHWDMLRRGGGCPRLTAFDPHALPDAASHSFLIALGDARRAPQIHFLGRALADEVGVAEGEIDLARLPRESLLAQLVRQLPRVADRAAPLAFEYDCPGAGAAPTHHRGILLPFTDPAGTIAYVQGIVGWRRAAPSAIEADVAAAIDTVVAIAPVASQPCPWSLPSDSGAPPLSLAQLLAAARTWAALAEADRVGGERNLAAALSATHDLLLAADAAPDAFDELDGPSAADPFVRAIRLAFGAGLPLLAQTRHRAVLVQARRIGLGPGMLLGTIQHYPGGIRALVRSEAARRRRARIGWTPTAPSAPISLSPVDSEHLRRIAGRPAFAILPDLTSGARAVG